MSWPVAAERSVEVEAVTAEARRVVIGVMAAKQRQSIEDAETLITGYLSNARAAGVSEARAYSFLFAHALGTALRLSGPASEALGESPEGLIRGLAAEAALDEM